ncbi:stalk domain-containing protein [Desulfofalx alkaliphila]|uniref:stalk domain-containing protein n=1 Tax=Desulfofalx alkaliphila TaxID=105483 RepID=UPI000690D091|nr:stalk domain-containing protein [Desulfofalx alkaliphila]
MKRRIVVLIQIVLLLLICAPAIAVANGADISLNLNKNTASVGESVTAAGKTIPNSWVPIKIIDADKNIVVFDAKKADASGNYSIDFKVPADVTGVLTVVVGEGTNVANKTLTVGTGAPVDTEAPTWPSSSTLSASNVTRNGLTLTWGAAVDNVGVTAYKIYKNGTEIATIGFVANRTYNVTGLTAGTSYTFKVEAGDAANNWSTNGPKITVTTSSSSGGGGGGGGGTITPSQSETEVSKSIIAATGGTVDCEELTVEIPAGALPGNATFSANKLTQSEANKIVPEGMRVKLGSDVYQITTTGSRNFGDNTITIKLAYNASKIAADEQPVLHYYDEVTEKWVPLETEIVQENGKWYAITHVNHLTKFAVFSTVKGEEIKEPVKVIKLTVGQVAAKVNGNAYTMDTAPYVDTQANRTLVPVRFVSEALGAKVNWNAETREVNITDGGKDIMLTIGSNNVLVNGQTKVIDCAPTVVLPGRTFVPLRFVSETLGATVDYDAVTKEITINR